MSKNTHTGIDPKIVSSVRYYVRKLKSNRHFARDEIEDLEQELMVFVFAKLNIFEPQKSTLSTFVSNVLKNKVRNLIKKRKSQKSEYSHSIFSLDDSIQTSDNCERLFETVDINVFIHNKIPKNLQQTCELLKDFTVDEIAKMLGKSQSAIYRHVERIRQLMNGFRLYQNNQINNKRNGKE